MLRKPPSPSGELIKSTLFEINVDAPVGGFVTMTRVVPLPGPDATGGPDQHFAGLRASATQAGIRIEIESGPEGTQFAQSTGCPVRRAVSGIAWRILRR